jgi:16S rRNA (uracil1498-N3)-methyltransferase
MGRILVKGMRRYWISPSDISQSEVRFEGDVFHHIFDVCRQEKGSKFEVLTGDQMAHFVEVVSVSKKSAVGKILESREIAPLKKPHIQLAISIPRYQVMDAIVEKAVELGVHSIHPFYSEFSFVRSQLPAGKLERWQKIVISASQQSGRGELMTIAKPISSQEILEKVNHKAGVLGLFAYEGESKTDIHSFLKAKKNLKDQEVREIWLFVGSEGGFSSTEVQEFHQAGLDSVTLGEQVLRVETACISLLAVLKYEFDLMR